MIMVEIKYIRCIFVEYCEVTNNLKIFLNLNLIKKIHSDIKKTEVFIILPLFGSYINIFD